MRCAAPETVPTTNSPMPHTERDVRQNARSAREKAFSDQLTAAKKSFDSSHKNGYMFLKILQCHADYRRRGAGEALTRWVIETAGRAGLDTVVFSSPMGYPLYQKVGFQEVRRFRVQVRGENEYLEIPALCSIAKFPATGSTNGTETSY